MEALWTDTKLVFRFIMDNLVYINLIFAIAVVFFQRKEPKSAWAWLLILYFVPVIGFIFYLLAGMDLHKQKIFKLKEVEDKLNDAIRKQENRAFVGNLELLDSNLTGYSDLVLYNLETQGAILTGDNKIRILHDGNEKFAAMLEDMRHAKKFIHMQYYIIKKDDIFEQILAVLEEKVKEGVEVRILFDAMGCRTFPKKRWKQIRQSGIQVAEFFPATFGRLNLRINYRNHRKIVVIDNEIGYVGGFNIAKEYVDQDKKIGHWCDTHLRMLGGAVSTLHLRFLLDWNYAARDNLFQNPMYLEEIPDTSLAIDEKKDGCEVQIIYSGPDSHMQNIRNNYLRLIEKAEKRIYIQTPYFIPDESVLSALMIAIHSGVEVNIMIPCKPDHPFVYTATLSYIGELVMAGANCYSYDNGFLHAKGIIVDDKVLCYGTANMDIRSFALNFEVNAIVYDEEKAVEMRQIFEKDVLQSTKITKNMYMERNLFLRIRERISRMLSPVL